MRPKSVRRNPLTERPRSLTSAHTRTDPTDDQLQAMWEDAEEVGRHAGQWLARWHNFGQREWLGGTKGKTSTTWHPSPRVKAAFKKMSEVMHDANSVGHELVMFMGERAMGKAEPSGAVRDNPKRPRKSAKSAKAAKAAKARRAPRRK